MPAGRVYAIGVMLGLIAHVGYGHANEIHTGGESGAYHSVFCPLLQSELSRLGSAYSCEQSAGTGANVELIARYPTHFAFGQLDAFALESRKFGGEQRFNIVRAGDVSECVFSVTRNKSLTNYGQIAVNADRLRFVLPPEESGSARTFRYMQGLDRDGLGKADNVSNALDTDDAIRGALADNAAVTFFVQFPDPKNERFQMIRRLGGHIVPVLDKTLLNRKINGETVYSAQETAIRQDRWLRFGPRVVTACTPMIIFTGADRRIASLQVRAAHQRLVEQVAGLPAHRLVPQAGPFADVLKQTTNLSSQLLFQFVRVSSNARERALPFVERAYRSARRSIDEMILKARPQP